MHRFTRSILILLGSLSLSLGILGIFLPLLPTTPFLLLTAACYAKGSERFYTWLMANRWLGAYIRNYREGRGVPLAMKIVTLALLWGTILVSVVFVAQSLGLRFLLIGIAVGVSAHIVWMGVRGRRREDPPGPVE